MAVDPSARIRPSPQVVARPVQDGLLIVNVNTGACWELNRTGAELWEAIAAGATVESFIARAAARYGLDPEAARHDFGSVAEELLARGLLVPVEDRPDDPRAERT